MTTTRFGFIREVYFKRWFTCKLRIGFKIDLWSWVNFDDFILTNLVFTFVCVNH